MSKFNKIHKAAIQNLKRLSFTHFASVAALAIAGVLSSLSHQSLDRKPSSEQGLELSIQRIGIDSISKIRGFENAFIRVRIGTRGEEVLEFGREALLSLKAGESKPLNIAVDLKEAWIKGDKTTVVIEIVEKGLFAETTALRCTTNAAALSTYNRSFNCSHPDESSPVISYRIAKRGSTPAKTLAKF